MPRRIKRYRMRRFNANGVQLGKLRPQIKPAYLDGFRLGIAGTWERN